jgi:hypothetical protein
LTHVIAILLVAGAMALAVTAIIGTVATGIIPVGRTGKISRKDAPLLFWLVILGSAGIVVLCAVDLIRMPLH